MSNSSRMKIGLDWDDVIAPNNSIAVKMANQKYQFNPPITMDEITSWENTGRASAIKEFYRDERLYLSQTECITEDTIACIHEIEKFADVYIITACYPEIMGIRAAQICRVFPELGYERIIMGAAKNLVQLDVLLDDCPKNILDSPATYPVLMRKPWNTNVSGIASVNNFQEFLALLDQIRTAGTKHCSTEPHVIALVGPSGAGKNELAELLANEELIKRPRTYSTGNDPRYTRAEQEDFAKLNFCEQTAYAGVQFGTPAKEIEHILGEGKYPVMVLDINGAVRMRSLCPTSIIYLYRRKRTMVANVVASHRSDEEKVTRLMSMDMERNNRRICDYTVDNTDSKKAAMDIIAREIKGKSDNPFVALGNYWV